MNAPQLQLHDLPPHCPQEPGAALAPHSEETLQRRCSAGGRDLRPCAVTTDTEPTASPPAPAPHAPHASGCATCRCPAGVGGSPAWRCCTGPAPCSFFLNRIRSIGSDQIRAKKCISGARGRRWQPAGHRCRGDPPRSSRPPPNSTTSPPRRRVCSGGGGAPAVPMPRPVERHHGVDVCARPAHGGGVFSRFWASAACFLNKLLHACGHQPGAPQDHHPCAGRHYQPDQRYLLVAGFYEVCWWAWPRAWPIGPLGLENAARMGW